VALAIVSSVGFLKTGHQDGEAGVARAAGAAGTIQFVSGVTNTPIEEIMAAATGPVFYQLYYIGGREASAPIIERAKAAGVSGLVLIADTPTTARPRDRLYAERRSVPAGVTLRDAIRFAPQALPKPRWLLDFVRAGVQEPQVAMSLRPDGTPMGLFEGIETSRRRPGRTFRGSANAGTGRS
jgi:pre-mycofactocin synthase